MVQTLDQQRAALKAKLAMLDEKARKLDTGQKVVLGGMLVNAAKKDLQIRKWLLAEAEKSITRDIDKKRIAPILAELAAQK